MLIVDESPRQKRKLESRRLASLVIKKTFFPSSFLEKSFHFRAFLSYSKSPFSRVTTFCKNGSNWLKRSEIVTTKKVFLSFFKRL